MGTIKEEVIRVCDSFIPSTIRQWNSLNPSLRNMESIAKFKTELRKQKDNRQVPKHFEIGPRKLNIALTQLRCFASLPLVKSLRPIAQSLGSQLRL
jgi:hypothetical protein